VEPGAGGDPDHWVRGNCQTCVPAYALRLHGFDITAKGKILAGRSYRYFEVYVTLALIYWASTIVIERAGHWLEEKWKIPGRQ